MISKSLNPAFLAYPKLFDPGFKVAVRLEKQLPVYLMTVRYILACYFRNLLVISKNKTLPKFGKVQNY